MKKWLSALLSETLSTVWWIVSALSTLFTYFFKNLSGKPRLIFATSAVVGFAWANFRVFRKQQNRIAELNAELSRYQERTSQLTITPDTGSRYILAPVNNLRGADFNGAWLEFHLMIENIGRRRSNVNNYRVEIFDLHETFPNLQPEERRDLVQGRHCQHALALRQILSTTRIISIDADSTTNHGTLLFFVPGLTLERFANAGLRMHGEQRKFDPLRCRLTLTDTVGSTATAEFQLHEE